MDDRTDNPPDVLAPIERGNGYEYDCEAPRKGAYSVEEMNAMASPEVRAMFEARMQRRAARGTLDFGTVAPQYPAGSEPHEAESRSAANYYEVEGAVFRWRSGFAMEVFARGKWKPYAGDVHRVKMKSNVMTFEEVQPYMDGHDEQQN
jgi:hypothetical protein